MPNTIAELIEAGAAAAPALGAPGRPDLDYAGLRGLAAEVRGALNAAGIGRGDRVAMVLPNGPEMAAAFVSVACAATAAPLNPAYKADEFAFYLDDLEARALIVEKGSQSPALQMAAERRIPIIELVPREGPAGGFELSAASGGEAARPGPSEPDDVALVLHTSGTTSRPKLVPLSQGNVSASAAHIAATLGLDAADRCLNVMPLFHIHGLMAALLASLGAGASVHCTPGFNALRFYAWLAEVEPTWYSAVPTMHQAILARAGRNSEIIAKHRLRFVRSSSSSLPPQVLAELSTTFKAPVVEAYGMTEAAHQMASNPVDRDRVKPGTVGLAAGPEVAIMDETGKLLAQGESGEIVIRGPNVTAGYVANPVANAEAFVEDWFRTGDQGWLDPDGYLTISGRLKEIINRGGEKISPREVDEVLMDHPAVAQAVAFALPHDKLGEEVAAAVVLDDGAAADEAELRDFVAGRLAAFKVPKRVVLLDEIPKGPTGKLQRIGLADTLGLSGSS
ncbi:MAG: acyl--CoA ligase [Alphaproteobacteria bacterium]|jgi:acyl-CoA synthetase (AMP-forming)/AMP-acid ligase II|nr:acyl--CoA ligase [Alphaproteobacteria bacterium]